MQDSYQVKLIQGVEPTFIALQAPSINLTVSNVWVIVTSPDFFLFSPAETVRLPGSILKYFAHWENMKWCRHRKLFCYIKAWNFHENILCAMTHKHQFWARSSLVTWCHICQNTLHINCTVQYSTTHEFNICRNWQIPHPLN